MQFIDYDSARSGVMINKSNNMIRLEVKLTNNLNAFTEHYKQTPIKYDNSHTLSRMCNGIKGYFGATPEITYENLTDRLRYISSMYGVAYPGSNQSTTSVITNDDFFAHKTFNAEFTNGVLTSRDNCFRVFNHDAVSLRLADYLEPSEGMSLIGVDIPLLGAVMHQETISLNKQGSVLDLNRFITEHFLLAICPDILNLALLNRFEFDSMDFSTELYNESYLSLSYQHQPTTNDYKKAIGDYRNYFKQFRKTSIADLYANLPLLTTTDYRINIKDYYMDSLMWINAFSEVGIYRKLVTLDSGYGLSLSLKPHENRLKKLLPPSKIEQMTRHLDTDYKDTVRYWLTK